MDKITKDSPESKSQDIKAQNIEQLKALFPEAVTEGRIDFEVLKQLLGGAVDERAEKYGLNWHGKRTARQLGLTPSTGTLRPCPGESVDWDKTQNLMIEGDNLEVLKLLQKSYSGKVKLIYIDPPYNTGKDFVYPDNFQDNIKNYLELTGQVEGGQKLTSNQETNGRFHTDWLNMMYPRLMLARNLLREDGVIAISIDDHEVKNLRSICDEVFGEENHIGTIVWQKRYVSNVTAKWLSDMHDFVVIYARNRELLHVNAWERTDDQLEAYRNPDDDPRGRWRAQDLSASKPYIAGQFPILGPSGETFYPPPNRYWRCNEAQFTLWKEDHRIWWGVNGEARPMLKSFLAEVERGITPHTWWDHDFAGHNKEATLELKNLFDGDSPFDTPKPVRLLRRILELFCASGDLVVDFFCGSGPLGHASMEISSNSRSRNPFILVQFPEASGRTDYPTIADITKERLRRAGKKIREENPLFPGDTGFRVFKLDTSNIRAWDPNYDDVSGSIGAYVEHLESKRTEADILYELLLKLGLDLCVPIERRQIAGKDIYSVGGGVLITCLAATINGQEGEAIALGICSWRAELDPAGDTTCVFRDAAFDGDVTKTNVVAILAQHGIHTVRSL